MKFVHRHKRRGALLALAALALQIALAFGHVHLNGLHLRGVSGGSHGTIATHHAVAQTTPQAPAQNPDDDDYCAICASIFLASTSFTSSPPALPVPIGFQRIEHSFDNARRCTEPRRLAFQSRAPPAA
jgi:Protein of unknown function (DUF2946)